MRIHQFPCKRRAYPYSFESDSDRLRTTSASPLTIPRTSSGDVMKTAFLANRSYITFVKVLRCIAQTYARGFHERNKEKRSCYVLTSL